MMPAAGMPAGSYELGGQPVMVDGVSARLADATLAGSIITLDDAIRNVLWWTDTTPAEAIAMASETPASLLGLTGRGRLAVGATADFALFDERLGVVETIMAGRRVFSVTERGSADSRGGKVRSSD